MQVHNLMSDIRFKVSSSSFHLVTFNVSFKDLVRISKFSQLCQLRVRSKPEERRAVQMSRKLIDCYFWTKTTWWENPTQDYCDVLQTGNSSAINDSAPWCWLQFVFSVFIINDSVLSHCSTHLMIQAFGVFDIGDEHKHCDTSTHST